MHAVQNKARRILLLIWDGLRPDFVTPEWTPNLWQMGRNGVVFGRHHAVFPTETRVNSASLATGCYPGRHGITGNQIYVPQVDPKACLNTGDHTALEAIARVEDVLGVPALSQHLAARGHSVSAVGAGSPGSSWLQCPAGSGVMVNVRGVVRPAHRESEFAPFRAESMPATAWNDHVAELLVHRFLPGDDTLVVGWFCDPDFTQHKVGLGAPLALQAISENDGRLGDILTAAERLGFDVLVGSDHGFSTLNEPADLMGQLLAAGVDARHLVHTGSSFWMPGLDRHTRFNLVQALMALPWVGPVFVQADGDEIPAGTFSLNQAFLDHPRRAPLVMFSRAWHDGQNDCGIAGTSLGASGASHGSCSPYDLHNVLVACGPSFQTGFESQVPSGLVDIAPTLHFLATGDPMPDTDGRVLFEALRETRDPDQVDQRVFEAECNGRTQCLETWTVNGTHYLEKGWVRPPERAGH